MSEGCSPEAYRDCGLRAEIKRLQDRVEYLDKRDARTLQEYGDLQEQFAAWQKIAIDERAEVLRIRRHNKPAETNWLDEAAKELGSQVEQEAGYLERLETDYLSWVREYYRDLGEERAIAEARAALEKIREGK